MTNASNGDRPVVVVDLTGWRRADLGVVDLVARVALQARRRDARVEVVVPGHELTGLLELAGLGAVVLLRRRAPASDPRRHAEALEEPGVEEVVDVGDAPAPQLEDLQGPRLVGAVGPAGLVLGEGGTPVERQGQEP